MSKNLLREWEDGYLDEDEPTVEKIRPVVRKERPESLPEHRRGDRIKEKD